MKFFTIQPPPQLAGVVNYFWVNMCNHTEEEIFTYYSIAETYAKLVFMYKLVPGRSFLNGEEYYYSALQGQTQTHDRFLTPGTFEIFGVSLRSCAVPRLFGFSAPEINDLTLDLRAVFGKEGKELDEKMASSIDTNQRTAILSNFLETLLKRNAGEETGIASAAQTIRASGGLVDISDLAKAHFLSHKQFTRKFLKESGFTPKLFARIVRFETAVCRYHSFESLTEMAHQAGYYDQSHFIRDFKEFAGFSPRRYFSVAADQI